MYIYFCDPCHLIIIVHESAFEQVNVQAAARGHAEGAQTVRLWLLYLRVSNMEMVKVLLTGCRWICDMSAVTWSLPLTMRRLKEREVDLERMWFFAHYCVLAGEIESKPRQGWDVWTFSLGRHRRTKIGWAIHLNVPENCYSEEVFKLLFAHQTGSATLYLKVNLAAEDKHRAQWRLK